MKKGFTLVELLVVVAILGILAAIGIVSFGGFTGSAKENVVKTNHYYMVRYMEAGILKCAIGEAILNIDNDVNDGWVCGPSTDRDKFWMRFLTFFANRIENPYITEMEQVVSGSSSCPTVLGQHALSPEPGNIIMLLSKYKEGADCLKSIVIVE